MGETQILEFVLEWLVFLFELRDAPQTAASRGKLETNALSQNQTTLSLPRALKGTVSEITAFSSLHATQVISHIIFLLQVCYSK